MTNLVSTAILSINYFIFSTDNHCCLQGSKISSCTPSLLESFFLLQIAVYQNFHIVSLKLGQIRVKKYYWGSNCIRIQFKTRIPGLIDILDHNYIDLIQSIQDECFDLLQGYVERYRSFEKSLLREVRIQTHKLLRTNSIKKSRKRCFTQLSGPKGCK